MGLFDKLKDTAQQSAANLKDTAQQSAANLKEKGSGLADKASLVGLAGSGAGLAATDAGAISADGAPLNPPVYTPTFVIDLAPWQQPEVSARSFSLGGEVMEVPEELDRSVALRRIFSGYAGECLPIERAEYDTAVLDFEGLNKNFPLIYTVGERAIAQRALEGLLSNGVFTVTFDQIVNAHAQSRARALAAAASYYEAIFSVDPNSTLAGFALNYTASLMPQYRPLFSTGSALGDMRRQNRMNVTNLVSSSVAAGFQNAARAASMPKPEKLAEYFAQIDAGLLFELVREDYAEMSYVVADFLNSEGGPSTWVPPESMERVSATLQNVTNPAFPKDQLPKVFIDLLLYNPYAIETQEAFIEVMGDTDETRAIRSYFGF